MRLSISPITTQVGDVRIHDLFRVTELDAGHLVQTNKNISFSQESLHRIESQLAVTIPCMNEELDILDGVLHGVPHDCLIILVSNSNSTNFKAECGLLVEYCENAHRQGIAVHQRDTGLALAFHAAGIPELVEEATSDSGSSDKVRRIRNGKGEAMMIGAAIAKLFAKKFVGFIDADNYTAGSIHEYCKVYAAGLHYALTEATLSDAIETPRAMVRIKWNSKPKPRGDKIVFEKSGRSSRMVNEWMNRLLNHLVGSSAGNESIQTGNAGEHAMTLDLAMELRFATGYAVEPYQLVNAWEQFGKRNLKKGDDALAYISPPASSPPSPAQATNTSMHQCAIQILQIQTRNPHFHDTSKGNYHIARMQVQGLSTIYHSPLTPGSVKEELRVYLMEKFPALVGVNGEPTKMRDYPPLGQMDWETFRRLVVQKAQTLVCIRM